MVCLLKMLCFIFLNESPLKKNVTGMGCSKKLLYSIENRLASSKEKNERLFAEISFVTQRINPRLTILTRVTGGVRPSTG